MLGAMIETLQEERTTADPEEDEGEFELFDVHAWFLAYRADDDAQAEHAEHAGVPFH
jgi:hypothetical protein